MALFPDNLFNDARLGQSVIWGNQQNVWDQALIRAKAQPQIDVARIGADAQKYGYDTQFKTAQMGDATSRYGIDAQANTAAARNATEKFGIEQQAASSRYGADQQTAQANIAAAASRYPYDLKQQRWNTVFPWVQSQLSGLTQNGFPGTGGGAGGGAGPAAITVGPVFSGDQVQQQVNARTAANDQATAGKVRGVQQSLAGHGFGGDSPLARALGLAAQNQNLAANTANERDTRLGAAQMNAQQVLEAEKARAAAQADYMQNQTEAAKIPAGMFSSLLAALGGMV